MFNARTRNTFGRKNIAVFAALAISSLAATPFVMSASRALAPSEDQPVAATLRVEPVEVAAVGSVAWLMSSSTRKLIQLVPSTM